LGRLQRDGIVITSMAELFANSGLCAELEAAVWERESAQRADIDKARQGLHDADRNKSYVFKLLGSFPTLDADDIFVHFALQPEVLALANGYFGMLTKLRYYNVWHNLPTHDAPRESQLWHRDPEDRAVLKMFVYFTDVGPRSGPLSYVPGTQAGGALRVTPASQRYQEGRSYVRRTDDAQMNAVAPQHTWVTATGPKGMVVLADTRGYHKGGWVQEGERILYTCMFTSQASTSPEVFKRPAAPTTHRDQAVAFAIAK
jgi:hypothetical protein